MAEKKLENSSLCRNILILTVLNAGVSLGYALTSLNPATPALRVVYNSTYQARYGENLPLSQWTTLLSLTMSMLLAGAFCGSITVTLIYQLFTIRGSMIFMSSVAIVGGVIMSAVAGSTGSYEALIIGRFIIGYALGIGLNTGPIAVSEYSTPAAAGRYQSMMGLGLAIGGVFGGVIGHPKVLGSVDRWPGVVAINCLLPLLYIVSSPWIPEAPRSLFRRGDREKGIKLLKIMRIADEDSLMKEVRIIEEAVSVDQEDGETSTKPYKPSFMGIGEILKNPQYRGEFLRVAMLYWGGMATGVNHATLFSDRIFTSAGIPPDVVTYLSIGVFTFQLIASIIGMRILAVVSPRRLILGALLITILSHIITTVSLVTRYNAPAMSYVAVIGILLLLGSTAGGPSLGMYALAGQLTSDISRPTILKYAGGVLWFTAWLTGFAAPYMEDAIGPYSFLVWCGFCIIYWLLVFFFVPETAEKPYPEVQRTLSITQTNILPVIQSSINRRSINEEQEL